MIKISNTRARFTSGIIASGAAIALFYHYVNRWDLKGLSLLALGALLVLLSAAVSALLFNFFLRWKYRSWLGDWFYLTEPSTTADVKDGGFAWMRFFLRDGTIAYEVKRFENFDNLEKGYNKEKRSLTANLAVSFFSALGFDVELDRSASMRDASAVSEAVVLDPKANSLVIFYSVAFHDPNKPPQKGRLELTSEGPLAARGNWRSLKPDGGGFVASYGTMFASRDMLQSAYDRGS